jgi:elongation factor P hydroxylase
MTQPAADDLVHCFNQLFRCSHNVELIGGGSEPLYRPPTDGRPAVIQFTHDYASSALHEVSHWCIAGKRRRTCVDYGYWYLPPPRDPQQQQAFAALEARVQALEAIFADAAGLDFKVSIDDVDNLAAYEQSFSLQVLQQRQLWQDRGLPVRAQIFRAALAALTAGRKYG